MGPLREVDQWGAELAVALVVGPSGVLASHGDPGAVTGVASITKLLSAAAVLLAVEEGTIALDDPVGQPGCTVEHLLCHAGGYDFDTPTVLAPPGTRRIYSNTGYELLADHLELRAGMPFHEYLSEGVLEPLGMGSSELAGSPAKDLRSCGSDLGRFSAELLAPTLLSPATMGAYRSVKFDSLAGVLPGWGRQDPCPWGLGPEIRGTKSPHWSGGTAPAATYGHFGASGSFLWVDPDHAIACVVLTDRAFGDWALTEWPGFSDRVRAHFSGASRD
jgi:CubicO group peptidase (beta-lactamase class C family)